MEDTSATAGSNVVVVRQSALWRLGSDSV